MLVCLLVLSAILPNVVRRMLINNNNTRVSQPNICHSGLLEKRRVDSVALKLHFRERNLGLSNNRDTLHSNVQGGIEL